MTNPNGRFGIYGGQYIPETLMNAVIELEQAYNHYKDDPEFNRELEELLNEYAGRPSRLYYAAKMTADLGGALPRHQGGQGGWSELQGGGGGEDTLVPVHQGGKGARLLCGDPGGGRGGLDVELGVLAVQFPNPGGEVSSGQSVAVGIATLEHVALDGPHLFLQLGIVPQGSAGAQCHH